MLMMYRNWVLKNMPDTDSFRRLPSLAQCAIDVAKDNNWPIHSSAKSMRDEIGPLENGA